MNRPIAGEPWLNLGNTMYSMKPGRGPSVMGGIGGIVVVLFGIFWLSGVSRSGAPGAFVAFGVLFVLLAICGVIYHFYNATADNRVSQFDIVRSGDEPDPFDKRLSNPPSATNATPPTAHGFCPYCGTALNADFSFCPKCGKGVK